MLYENTLKVVYIRDYIHDNRGSDSDGEKNIALEFVETDIILQSNTWLKAEKRFWCDKEKFQAWKKNQ